MCLLYHIIDFLAATMSPQSRSKSADTNLRHSNADIKRSIDRLAQPKPKRTGPPAVPSPTKNTMPRMPTTPARPKEPTQKAALTPVKNTPTKVSGSC